LSATPVEFWFEFANTYSYPAAARVEAAARAAGVPLLWRAFLLGPIFQQQGWNDSPFNLYPVKGRYMWRDLARICADLSIPLRRPSRFPRGSLVAARVACRFAGEAWLPEFVRAVYRANFAEDRDIADPAEIEGCLDALGQPGKKRLEEAQGQRAVERGIFGAPSFVVAGELFWGNDRLDAALAWARRGAPASGDS
jgi:2-hydroxychromene-2-carboxylate isomerase